VILYIRSPDWYWRTGRGPKIRLNNTANQVLIDGYQCDGQRRQACAAGYAATRSQGSVIKVCVRPTWKYTAGILIRRLLHISPVAMSAMANQPAVTSPNTASNNGLTILGIARSCQEAISRPFCSPLYASRIRRRYRSRVDAVRRLCHRPSSAVCALRAGSCCYRIPTGLWSQPAIPRYGMVWAAKPAESLAATATHVVARPFQRIKKEHNTVGQ
jgi:hypothetical protein